MECLANLFRPRRNMHSRRSFGSAMIPENESASINRTLLLALFYFRYIVVLGIGCYAVMVCVWSLKFDCGSLIGLQKTIGLQVFTAVGLIMCLADVVVTSISIYGENTRRINFLILAMAYLLLLMFLSFLGLIVAVKVGDTDWIIVILVAIIFNGFTFYMTMNQKEEIIARSMPSSAASVMPSARVIGAPMASVAATGKL